MTVVRDERPVAGLALEPAPMRAKWLLFLLVLVLPLVLVLVLPEAGRDAQRPIAQIAGGDPVLLRLYAAMVVLAVLGGIFVLLLMMMRRHRLVLDANGLEVTTSFYRRRLPWPELKVGDARIVSLDERPELKPTLRSNALRVPGFSSGWFRSRSLGKLLVATAGGDRLLWLPTTQGYDLLLQPRNPQAALQRIRELASMASPPQRR